MTDANNTNVPAADTADKTVIAETAVAEKTETPLLDSLLAKPVQKQELEAVETKAMAPAEIQKPDAIQAQRPEFLSDEEDAELRRTAQEFADQIAQDPSNVEITTRVYDLGAEHMADNSQQVALMDTKMSEVLGEINTGNPVAKNLVQIKANLDLINPAVVGQTETTKTKKVFFGLFTRTMKYIPKGDQILEMIAARRETVKSTLEGLKQHLWAGRDLAIANATQLGTISDKLFDTQEELQKSVYFGQLLWAALAVHRDSTDEPVGKQALSNLVQDLGVQVVDLQTVDTVNVQSRLAAEALINNVNKIRQAVARVTNVLLPAVATNLAVRAAAQQQLQVLDAANQISGAASQTIADTAKATRQATVEGEKRATEALINVEALQTACDELVGMMDDIEQIRAEAETTARETSAALNQVTGTMRRIADPMTEKRQARSNGEAS